ncbi:MAG: hypothetical protein HRU20_18615 [Pseudomonadales bacterium]|nr:hypothetical protein [Pseudomonadales bacterium]NRB40451.1 hypothetical protein [Pseudomonadales bacterium]
MSTWRRKALEFLPEFRKEVESSNSASELWIEIYDAFGQAVDSGNEEFVKGTLKYLTWCTSDSVSDELQQALYCGFLEDITYNKKRWPLFNSWFNTAQFEKYKGSFQYALSEKEFTQLENIFYGK